MGSSILISAPGEFEVEVVSTSIDLQESCDSIVGDLIVHPNPAAPIIEENKIFCDPFITELSVENFESVSWTSSVDFQQEAPSIQVSQNGLYSASYVDENGCSSTSGVFIQELDVDFGPLLEFCVQACREDIDSLAISVPGIEQFFTSWMWLTNDSLGNEVIVSSSSGWVDPVTITSEMYNFIQLEITEEECVFRSEQLPLDIQICSMPEPPEEIPCEQIDSDHASCGQSIYKCLLSEENGGPKLYFEGSVVLPENSELCHPDSLKVSLNNGEIHITELELEQSEGSTTHFTLPTY